METLAIFLKSVMEKEKPVKGLSGNFCNLSIKERGDKRWVKFLVIALAVPMMHDAILHTARQDVISMV